MRCNARAGFTLIELIIAAFIFAVGVLALEATAASALREMQRSARVTAAASLARSRLERVAASGCANASVGADTVAGVISSWSAPAAAGSLSRVVHQTISYDVGGSWRSDTYLAAVPCG